MASPSSTVVPAADAGAALHLPQDPAALFEQAQAFANGTGVAADPTRAAALYRQAAEAGHAESMYKMAELTAGAWFAFPSSDTWQRCAAEAGCAEAQYSMGMRHAFNTHWQPADIPRAKEWFEKAAHQGHTGAQLRLGSFAADAADSFRWALSAALLGDADGQFLVGEFYLRGEGTEANVPEAIRWLEAACLQGHSGAQLTLARVAETEAGGLTLQRAIDIYQMRASHDNGMASMRLGRLYEEGRGVEQSYGEAVRCYRAGLARWGSWHEPAVAQTAFRLAHLLETSLGSRSTSDAHAEALSIYEKLTRRLDWMDAEFARVLEIDTRISPADREAAYRAARMHEEGRGTPQDDVKALKYYKLAVALGHEAAREDVQRFEDADRGSRATGCIIA